MDDRSFSSLTYQPFNHMCIAVVGELIVFLLLIIIISGPRPIHRRVRIPLFGHLKGMMMAMSYTLTGYIYHYRHHRGGGLTCCYVKPTTF